MKSITLAEFSVRRMNVFNVSKINVGTISIVIQNFNGNKYINLEAHTNSVLSAISLTMS